MQTFPGFAALACWQWQKRWVLLCGGVVTASKRSYASKVHRLDLHLAFFTASKTANCAWEMSLKEKRYNGFHFFHQNFLEMKDGFSEAETVLYSCEAALYKVTQSIWLGTFWTCGHFFWSLFAFQSLRPNPNLPHSTLNKFTAEWGAEWKRRVHRHDRECNSREQGRKKAGSEVVTEEVTHASSQSRQMGVNRQ